MKIKCLICNDTIESKYIHNLVDCRCSNCYIDGGQTYLHFGGQNLDKILTIFDDCIEIIASDEEKYYMKYKKWEDNKLKGGV